MADVDFEALRCTVAALHLDIDRQRDQRLKLELKEQMRIHEREIGKRAAREMLPGSLSMPTADFLALSPSERAKINAGFLYWQDQNKIGDASISLQQFDSMTVKQRAAFFQRGGTIAQGAGS